MNTMHLKTPEERKAIAAKGVETRRINRLDRQRRREDAMVRKYELKGEIEELEKKRDALESHQAMSLISSSITGKALLSEAQIVKHGQPWNNCTGVYFLIRTGKVVYVGQAKSVFQRVGSHKDKEFDSVAWVPCAAEILDALESLYIHVMRPPLNGNWSDEIKCAPMPLDKLLRMTPNA